MNAVLVTGGAGFIGSHLVDHHLAKGDRVAVIDNLTTGNDRNIARHRTNPDFTFHHAAVQDFPGLAGAVGGTDVIYHLAAVVGVREVLKSPLAVLESNVTATQRLLKTVVTERPGARVVVASSSEVYGLQSKVPFSEIDDLLLPSRDPLRWCYATTKLTCEMIVYAFARDQGVNGTAVRLFNTAGTRQSPAYGMVLPSFVEKALKGAPLEIYGDGKQTRSFSDIRDTVAALALVAACSNAFGLTVNVGGEEEVSIGDLAARVIRLANSPSKIIHKTYEEAYGHDFVDVQRRRSDLTRLRNLTGFAPRFSLDDTILSLIESYRAQG